MLGRASADAGQRGLARRSACPGAELDDQLARHMRLEGGDRRRLGLDGHHRFQRAHFTQVTLTVSRHLSSPWVIIF
jgi:hypothetical protein